jgi:hypothetical protein
MRPYIPKQIKPIRERVEAKLDRELIVELEQFCQYLESDRDYIIAQALRVAFRKDKGFAEWQQIHPLQQPGIDGTDGTNPPNAGGPK